MEPTSWAPDKCPNYYQETWSPVSAPLPGTAVTLASQRQRKVSAAACSEGTAETPAGPGIGTRPCDGLAQFPIM